MRLSSYVATDHGGHLSIWELRMTICDMKGSVSEPGRRELHPGLLRRELHGLRGL